MHTQSSRVSYVHNRIEFSLHPVSPVPPSAMSCPPSLHPLHMPLFSSSLRLDLSPLPPVPQLLRGPASGDAVWDPSLPPQAERPPAEARDEPSASTSGPGIHLDVSASDIPGRLHLTLAPELAHSLAKLDHSKESVVSDVFNPQLMDHPLVKLVDRIAPALPDVDKYGVYRVPLVRAPRVIRLEGT